MNTSCCGSSYNPRVRGGMTLAQAKDILRPLGITINRTRAHTSSPEYRVNFAQGGTEASAYYTDDLEDAVNTGKSMAAWKAQQPATVFGGNKPLELDPLQAGVLFGHYPGGVSEDFPSLDAAVAHARTLPDGDKMVVYYKRGKFHLAAGPFRPIHPHPVGAMTENPRHALARTGYYRRHYFDDIEAVLIDRYGFTRTRAKFAINHFRRDIHEYYNYGHSAAYTANKIVEYL